MIRILVPTALRGFVDGAREVALTLPTPLSARELLRALAIQHPELAARICDEAGAVRRFVNVFVGDEELRALAGLDTVVNDGDVVSIIPALAGGNALRDDQVRRYARHILLPEVGGHGQRRLLAATCAIRFDRDSAAAEVAAEYLAAAGVGTIELVAAGESTIAARIAALNPDVRVVSSGRADALFDQQAPLSSNPALDLAAAMARGSASAVQWILACLA